MSISKRFGLALAVVLGLGGTATAQESVVAILGQSVIGANEAFNVFVPQKMGYFEEEGLDVEFQTSQGGTQVMQLLAAGQADIGLASVPGVMLARQQDIPVASVYNYLRDHATALAVLEDGPIKDPKELKGKRIGVVSMSSTRTFDGRAMIRAAGLDPDTDVEFVPVGFGGQAAAALTRGDVAALSLWDATYADIESQGVDLKFFTFPFQEDLIGYVYVSTDGKLQNRRDVLIRFLRAVAKGTVFATEDPEAATCIYFEETDALAQAQDRDKAFQDAQNVVVNNVENAVRGDESILWGSFPENAWAVNQGYYQELGVVTGDLPAEEYYVEEESFYQEINDFDAETVKEQARAYQCGL